MLIVAPVSDVQVRWRDQGMWVKSTGTHGGTVAPEFRWWWFQCLGLRSSHRSIATGMQGTGPCGWATESGPRVWHSWSNSGSEVGMWDAVTMA